MGRPSAFSQPVVDEICEHIANGKSLKSFCDADEHPRQATVFRWLADNEVFRENYARAREAQADVLADEILEIANTPHPGIKTETKGDEVKTIEGDMIEHRRLQVDARKWIASKLKPKKYGDKVDLTHGNPDGTPLSIQIVKFGSKTPASGSDQS